MLINPQNEGVWKGHLTAISVAHKQQGLPVGSPLTGRPPWGLERARMAENLRPPGAVLQTKLVWGRCRNSPRCGHNDCRQAGKCLAGGTIVLPCSRCWYQDRVSTNLTILGPLDAPLGVTCERCGGLDGEVQYEHSPEIERQVAEIAKWNTELNRQIRKKQ